MESKQEKMIAKATRAAEVKEKASRAKSTFWKYLPNIVIILLSTVLLSLLSTLIFDFDFKYLWQPQFFIVSILLSIIYSLVHWSAYNAKLKKNRENLELQKHIKENDDKIKVVTNSVEWKTYRAKFIANRNMSEKIEAWKVYIQNRLTTLNDKARRKDKQLELQEISEFEINHLDETLIEKMQYELNQRKKANKYIAEKRELEGMLDDAWIANNINKINIEFNEIDSQFIETGSMYQSIKKDKANSKLKYFRENMPQKGLSILLTVFITSFSSSFFMAGLTAKALFDFGTRVILLIFNSILGANYGDTFYLQVDVHNSDARESITGEFIVWLNEVKK